MTPDVSRESREGGCCLKGILEPSDVTEDDGRGKGQLFTFKGVAAAASGECAG